MYSPSPALNLLARWGSFLVCVNWLLMDLPAFLVSKWLVWNEKKKVSYPARLLSPATSTCSVSFFTVLLRQTSMMLVVIWKNWTILDHWSLSSAKATIPLLRVSLIFSKSTFFMYSSAVSAMNCLSSWLVSFSISHAVWKNLKRIFKEKYLENVQTLVLLVRSTLCWNSWFVRDSSDSPFGATPADLLEENMTGQIPFQTNKVLLKKEGKQVFLSK